MWSTSCTANYQDKQIHVYTAHSQIFFILGSLKWSVTAHCLPSHPAPARTNRTKLKIIEKEARSKAQTPAELGAVMVAACPADNVLHISLCHWLLTGLRGDIQRWLNIVGLLSVWLVVISLIWLIWLMRWRGMFTFEMSRIVPLALHHPSILPSHPSLES